MNLYQVLTEKRGEILALAERYGVKNIRIFGSVARYEARDESDIDFLVEFPPYSSLITHAAFQRELSSLLGCPVDVASSHGLNDRVRRTVTQDAIPLLGRIAIDSLTYLNRSTVSMKKSREEGKNSFALTFSKSGSSIISR